MATTFILMYVWWHLALTDSDLKNIENSDCIDQLESDCEEIQIKNYSDPRIPEKSKTVDQSDSDCEEIRNHSDLKNIENSAQFCYCLKIKILVKYKNNLTFRQSGVC